MSDIIQFVKNYEDLSTDRGYQFRFHCDMCGNGYMSSYKTSSVAMASSLLRAASSMLGGIFSQVSHGSYEIQRAIGGKAHDDALREAVAEIKHKFKQCSRCGKWVCPQICWNEKRGLCLSCAPDLARETAAAQAQAACEQIREKVQKTDYVADIDVFGQGDRFVRIVRRGGRCLQVLSRVRRAQRGQGDLPALRNEDARLHEVLSRVRRETASGPVKLRLLSPAVASREGGFSEELSPSDPMSIRWAFFAPAACPDAARAPVRCLTPLEVGSSFPRLFARPLGTNALAGPSQEKCRWRLSVAPMPRTPQERDVSRSPCWL